MVLLQHFWGDCSGLPRSRSFLQERVAWCWWGARNRHCQVFKSPSFWCFLFSHLQARPKKCCRNMQQKNLFSLAILLGRTPWFWWFLMVAVFSDGLRWFLHVAAAPPWETGSRLGATLWPKWSVMETKLGMNRLCQGQIYQMSCPKIHLIYLWQANVSFEGFFIFQTHPCSRYLEDHFYRCIESLHLQKWSLHRTIEVFVCFFSILDYSLPPRHL